MAALLDVLVWDCAFILISRKLWRLFGMRTFFASHIRSSDQGSQEVCENILALG